MIQNILTFCVKNDLTFVEGSIPSGKLVANDINRNSIYLVTPYDEAIVKANFQTNLQSDTPTSVLGILVNGKITIDEIVPNSKSYYNLVKDWNIYEFKVPSTTLSFISRNRTGKIGINFSIEQRLVPTIKPSYGEYQGEILSQGHPLLESGYYINKTIGFELDTGNVITYDLNDILVLTKQSPEDIQVKISAYSNRGSTPTTLYSVDPSLLNDNFETIEPSLTTQIVQQVNDNTGDIVLLFQNVGVNNSTLVDLENRMSDAEQDIDTAEANITNLQGRMNIAESDIEDIEDGTTIVEKALRDSVGNVIKSTYANKLDLGYSSSNNRIAITLKSYDGTSLDADLIDLPKATTLKDGLLAKEDKVKINAIASDIASAISTHDGSQTSHLYIRTLIANLQKEVDRINAKGRSWGEVDKTFSELWAMAEPTRSDYINTFLATAFSGYTPSNGDLIYTIVSDTEEEHELEYNSTLSQWVDNGAYIVGKASNDQYGIVKGDLNYVSILNGIIQVLKSDYATNVGSSGASYDYGDLLALFTEVANDIYNKSETYSRAEVDLLISNLSHYFNLQETAIEYSTGVYDFPNGATKPYTLFQDYNWVKFRFFNNVSGRARAYYTFIKPAMAISGNNTLIQIQRTPVRYARIRRTNGDIVFDIIDENDNVDTSVDYTMRCWGEELVQLTANEVDYDNSTSGLVADKVQGAIDEVVVELNALETKIDSEVATLDLVNSKQDIRINEIEELARKSASGETSDNVLGTDVIPLSKDTANAPMSVEVDGGILEAPNLVVNGDFSNGTTGWETSTSTFNVVNGIMSITGNGVSNQTSISRPYTFQNIKYYAIYRARVTNNVSTQLRLRLAGGTMDVIQNNPIENQWYILSGIGTTASIAATFALSSAYADAATANGKVMQVDYAYTFNVLQMQFKGVKDDNGTPFTLLTNAQIKTQLDLWVSKGIIPNDNLLSVNMNKRVRSEVGGATINEMYQLVSNYDLTVDSNSDGIPDGFSMTGTRSNQSLTNGIMKYTTTSSEAGLVKLNIPTIANDKYYAFAYIKTTGSTYLDGLNSFTYLSNALYNQWALISKVSTSNTMSNNYIGVYALENETIEIDFIGAYNISTMKRDGWFVGMDDTQIKAFLDKVLQQGKANSDLYLQANTKGYSLPNGVKDTIEYRNGKYYYVKRVDDTDLNNLVELSPYVETEIEAWGNLQGYESGIVYVDDIKIDASVYASGITTTSEIKALDEIVKITNGVETQIDTSLAVIAVDKLSFTHPDLVDGDYVWFAYEEDGNYYKATSHITYYIDKLVRTSPDGSVWKLDWSVDNSGVVTWTPTKI